MVNQVVLGIDGGGTKTQAAIADLAGNILGSGLGGPSNVQDAGVAAAQANISEAVNVACQNAGLLQAEFASAFLGLAGVVCEQDRTAIRDIALNLKLAQPAAIGIDHDCRIALAGGLSGRPGIALISGTGSSCYGRSATGQAWFAGGWGYLISNEGSSYWLGLQAMRTAVMAYDGRIGSSLLLDSVLRHFGLSEVTELVPRIYIPAMSRSEVASLAPLVINAAKDNDPTALKLLSQSARELAECVLAVSTHLGLSGPNGTDPCEVVLIGGLLKAGEIFTTPLRHAILDSLPQARISLAELPPVAGACLLALQGLGSSIDSRTVQTMQNSISRLG